MLLQWLILLFLAWQNLFVFVHCDFGLACQSVNNSMVCVVGVPIQSPQWALVCQQSKFGLVSFTSWSSCLTPPGSTYRYRTVTLILKSGPAECALPNPVATISRCPELPLVDWKNESLYDLHRATGSCSSVYIDMENYAYGINNLIDGNQDTGLFTLRLGLEWVEFDLGADAYVSRIMVYPNPFNPEHMMDALVLLKNSAGKLVYTGFFPVSPTPIPPMLEFNPIQKVGRVLRIQQTRIDNLQLVELLVFTSPPLR
jgi:hypothetical protein